MKNGIYVFGEKKEDKWYELSDGRRIQCSEQEIMALWMQWSMNKTAERCDKDGYAIFKVSDNPLCLTVTDEIKSMYEDENTKAST